MRKRIASALLLVLTLFMVVSVGVFASWELKFPTTIIDTSAVARTYYPTLLGWDGQTFIDSGKIAASGLDTNMQISTSSVKYMLSTTQTTVAIPTLPASGSQDVDFYTGYAPVQTGFPVITGDYGWYWTADAAALEPANNFEFDQSGYIDTSTYHGNQKLIYKQEAYVERVSSVGNIETGIINTESYLLTTTNDGAWHTLDVSDYIGNDATMIILEYVTDGTQYSCGFSNYTTGVHVANYKDATHMWVMVQVDSSGRFDYRLEDNACDVYLRGYTQENYWYYNAGANIRDINLGGIGAWTTVDMITGVFPYDLPVGTDGIIVEVVNTDLVNPYAVGLRKNGSADNRTDTIAPNNHFWAVIGLDADGEFDGYIENVLVDYYLVGYVVDGTTFKTNATDISLGGVGLWTDINLAASAPSATYAFVESTLTGAAGSDWGYRKNGSSENIIIYPDDSHVWSFIETDYSQIIESYISSLNENAYLVGYSTAGIIHADCTAYTYSSSLTSALTSGVHEIDVTEDPALDFGAAPDVDYIDCGNVVVSDPIQDMTMLAWVKPDAGLGGADLIRKDRVDIGSTNWTGVNKFGFYDFGAGGGWRQCTTAPIVAATWQHIAFSKDDAVATYYYNGVQTGATVACNVSWNMAAPADTMYIGNSDGAGGANQYRGDIAEVMIFARALSAVEIAAIYDGSTTFDTTGLRLWYKLNENAGVNVTDSSGNGYNGTITGAAWGNSLFKLTIDDDLKDFDTGTSVPDNICAWEAAQGNVLPYTDYDYRDVSGVEVVKYEPMTMLIDTAIPDRTGAAQNATIVWGENRDVTITYGEMTSYESTSGATADTGGFGVPSSPLSSTWFAGGENLATLPFYDSFLDVSLQTGQPLQTIYFLAIIGFAFGVFLLLVIFTRSALLGAAGFNIILFVGSSMTIIPMWIPFAILIVMAGIMYLYKQVAY